MYFAAQADCALRHAAGLGRVAGRERVLRPRRPCAWPRLALSDPPGGGGVRGRRQVVNLHFGRFGVSAVSKPIFSTKYSFSAVKYSKRLVASAIGKHTDDKGKETCYFDTYIPTFFHFLA